MEETPLDPDTVLNLDNGERFDWLRLLRCENIGPRTFQVLLSRHGSAGAALAALPALIASGKPGRQLSAHFGDAGADQDPMGTWIAIGALAE
jgi:predicted Rossmann fold nucleotide-binding protein DprA/Smf involved in DNA uptake